jgi:DNA-binding transcriptional LysR family regulator
LALIHSGLNQRPHFEPAFERRAVTIGMTGIGEIAFLPELLARLRLEAPGITLNTVRTSVTTLREDMESGREDLAIGLLPELKAGFFQRRLFTQRYVCLFRKGYPLDRKGFTLSDFQETEHPLIASAGTGHGKVDDLIRRSGIERKVRLTVPHFMSVGHILQRSDMVAAVTERLAQSLADPFSLIVRPHPVAWPDVAINLFWHAKMYRSGLHQWLRGVVFDLFGSGRSGQ